MKAIVWKMFAVIVLGAAVAGSAFSTTYHTVGNPSTDTVHFASSAKLEFVEGMTGSISGSIEVSPDSGIGSTKGIFQVDLRTLKTGIDLRDEHMRTRHLKTDKYPYAYFEISSIADPPTRLASDSTYQMTAAGKFCIHGNWRPITVTTTVRRSLRAESDALAVRAAFTIKLDDFGIPRPKALFLKLAETINIEVIFTAANNLPPVVISLPDWPEKK